MAPLSAARIAAIGALLFGLAGIYLSYAPGVLDAEKCPWLPRNAPLLTSALTKLKVMLGFVPKLTIPVDPADGLAWFTLAELAQYDGSDETKPLLLAVKGSVFDVTEKGSHFYGKDMAYNVFAGKDGTRALTLGSLDPKDVLSTDVSDFTPVQLGELYKQHAFYADKYTLVGKLRPGEGAQVPPLPEGQGTQATPTSQQQPAEAQQSS